MNCRILIGDALPTFVRSMSCCRSSCQVPLRQQQQQKGLATLRLHGASSASLHTRACYGFSTRKAITISHPTSPGMKRLPPPPHYLLLPARSAAYAYSTRPNSSLETTGDLYSSEILPSSSAPSSTPTATIATPSSPSPPSPLSYASLAFGTQRSIPIQKTFDAPSPKAPPPRLGSSEGRSIAVRNGDLQGALLRLQRVVAENKVKSDHHRQKFHERKGLKRKRLRSERYRKRFKEGFKKMIGVVLEMKRQGL